MESHVLGYKSPLYGRRRLSIKLEPLSFFHLREFSQRRRGGTREDLRNNRWHTRVHKGGLVQLRENLKRYSSQTKSSSTRPSFS